MTTAPVRAYLEHRGSLQNRLVLRPGREVDAADHAPEKDDMRIRQMV